MRGRKGLTPSLLADTQFALAKALHQSGEDRTRARELARKARKTYDKDGPGQEGVESVDRWLAAVGDDENPSP